MEATDGTRHYRQFRLELIDYDADPREVQVHLYVSQLLTEEECQQADLDLEAKREVDTNFLVGLFDFPMIDNTRLSGSERSAGVADGAEPERAERRARLLPGVAREPQGQAVLRRSDSRSGAESPAVEPDESITGRWSPGAIIRPLV